MTADDLTALNEQIAAMARAGLPLDQGLASLARDMGRGRLRDVTEALAADLRSGRTLPEALARQEGHVPPYYASLVTAGVQTGRLPEALATLSTYAKSVAAVRVTLIEALIYPFFVLVVGYVLYCLLAFGIAPEFDQVFQGFGMKVPETTELIMTIGRNPILFGVLPVTILLGSLIGLWTWGRVSPKGKRIWTQFVYGIPLLGRVIRSARLAAFTDLLAMMVEQGVPLPAAFRMAGAASSDPIIADRAAAVEQRLNEGLPLAEAFRGRGLAPDWVVWLAAAGEQRNALGPALREIANVYRRQVDNGAALLRGVLPSLVVIVIAGVLTTLFAIGIFAPMIKLLEGLSKG